MSSRMTLSSILALLAIPVPADLPRTMVKNPRFKGSIDVSETATDQVLCDFTLAASVDDVEVAQRLNFKADEPKLTFVLYGLRVRFADGEAISSADVAAIEAAMRGVYLRAALDRLLT